MAKKTFRYLSRDDVKKTLDMATAIPLMKEAFRQLSQGTAKVPVRINMPISEEKDCALVMPVYLSEPKKMGIKFVSINYGNPAQNLPLIHAMLMLFDSDTGAPLALMDGEHITALRTGAASGLATSLLAREDSRILAIFGAGVQARYQMEAVLAVRKIDKTIIFNRDQKKGEAFARELSELYACPVIRAEKAEELLEADIICTATNAHKPVFSHKHVKEGAHINGIGSYNRNMVEVPPEIVRQAQVIVDSRVSAFQEAGDLDPLKELSGWKDEAAIVELGELQQGSMPLRKSDKTITFFKTVGNAVQDLVTATHLYQKAEQQNLGQILPL